MGASPRTKSDYLREIQYKTERIADYQSKIASLKGLCAQPSQKHMKSNWKASIAEYQGHIARLKGEISVLKLKMKDAPKG